MSSIQLPRRNRKYADLTVLYDEYESVLHKQSEDVNSDGEIDTELLVEELVATCEWTRESACNLIELVQAKGSFVLRNAAAIALVLGIEDGADGQ